MKKARNFLNKALAGSALVAALAYAQPTHAMGNGLVVDIKELARNTLYAPVDTSISGTNTGYGVAGVSGTLVGIECTLEMAANVGGTSATVTFTNNGSVVASTTIPSSTVAGTRIAVTPNPASPTTISGSSVIGVQAGAGLTTSNTAPNNLVLNCGFKIKPNIK